MGDKQRLPPILRDKAYTMPSRFRAESLLREARRQYGLNEGTVPKVCVLDPDGDIVAGLQSNESMREQETWACYHTTLYTFNLNSLELGIVRHVVGAPFAVLVAEELFASGCELLIHVTSAGQIVQREQPPFFILVERAFRDEGTSYHYLAPAEYVSLAPDLLDLFRSGLRGLEPPVYTGASWTTDAPFRETEEAIHMAEERGILAVEMEVAGLYAFGEARGKPIVSFAHITNRMGQTEGDFEKGADAGSLAALQLIGRTAGAWTLKQKNGA